MHGSTAAAGRQQRAVSQLRTRAAESFDRISVRSSGASAARLRGSAFAVHNPGGWGGTSSSRGPMTCSACSMKRQVGLCPGWELLASRPPTPGRCTRACAQPSTRQRTSLPMRHAGVFIGDPYTRDSYSEWRRKRGADARAPAQRSSAHTGAVPCTCCCAGVRLWFGHHGAITLRAGASSSAHCGVANVPAELSRHTGKGFGVPFQPKGNGPDAMIDKTTKLTVPVRGARGPGD